MSRHIVKWFYSIEETKGYFTPCVYAYGYIHKFTGQIITEAGRTHHNKTDLSGGLYNRINNKLKLGVSGVGNVFPGSLKIVAYFYENDDYDLNKGLEGLGIFLLSRYCRRMNNDFICLNEDASGKEFICKLTKKQIKHIRKMLVSMLDEIHNERNSQQQSQIKSWEETIKSITQQEQEIAEP